MKLLLVVRPFLALLVAASALVLPRSSLADAADHQGAVGVVIVVVHSDSPLVNEAAVREAVARELGAPVTGQSEVTPGERATARGTAVVTYREHEKQLAVTWEDAVHGSVTRVVDAPSRAPAILRTVAHLTGELSRNDLGLPAAASPALSPMAESPLAPPPPSTSLPAPAPPAVSSPPGALASSEPPRAWGNVSFIYPLALNAGHPDIRTHVDLALPASRIGTLAGFGLGVVEIVDEVRGMQLGVVNVAGRLHGAQLGLVNVDGEVDGLPLGLVSVSREGGIHPLAWFDTLTEVNAGARFATRSTYTILAAAGHFDGGRSFAGGSFTAGGTLHFARVAFSIDAGYTYLRDVSDRADGDKNDLVVDEHLERLRASLALSIFSRLTPFAGAGLTVRERFDKAGDIEDTTARPDFFAGLEW